MNLQARLRTTLPRATTWLLASALLLASCSPVPASRDATGNPTVGGEPPLLVLRMSARDNHFDPTLVSVNSGRSVEIIFMSESKDVHHIEAPGLLAAFTLNPREVKTYTVVVERGKHLIVCRTHEKAGMTAELIGE